jgi:hypothetical protein
VRRRLAETLGITGRRGASIWVSSRAAAPHRMKWRTRSRCSLARVQRSLRFGAASLRAVRGQTRNAPRSPMEPIARPENPDATGRDRCVSARNAEFLIANDWRLENAPPHRAARPVSGGIAARRIRPGIVLSVMRADVNRRQRAASGCAARAVPVGVRGCPVLSRCSRPGTGAATGWLMGRTRDVRCGRSFLQGPAGQPDWTGGHQFVGSWPRSSLASGEAHAGRRQSVVVRRPARGRRRRARAACGVRGAIACARPTARRGWRRRAA